MSLVIFGKTLSNKKKIKFALKRIYGISEYRANQICRTLGFAPELLITDLTRSQRINLVTRIKNEYIVESNLIEMQKLDLDTYYTNGSLRGTRLRLGLPVRGQRTHSNGKSARRRKK